MKLFPFRFLLLFAFVLWGTGTAKFLHEQIEHHGRDMSLADTDDDDDGSSISQASGQNTPSSTGSTDQSKHSPKHSDSPCPICQMLATMSANRSQPPVLPEFAWPCIAKLVVVDQQSPVLNACFVLPARGPPLIPSCI